MKKVKRYTIKKKSVDKSKPFLERYGDKIVSAPEYKDSVKYIREMRDKE